MILPRNASAFVAPLFSNASLMTGTRSGIFPPILLMINKYTATAEVRIVLGTSSTTIARVMPIHISPIVI